MQLPRGTFREIKKNELVSSILDEFEHTRFSGICSISSGPVSGTLVFKSGKCILAKIQQKSGDGAWDELQKMSDHEVDAALSSLDEAQIQLALEFNKTCRVIKAGKTAPVTVSHPQKPAPVVHTATAAHPEPAKKPVLPPHIAVAPVKPDTDLQKPAPETSPTTEPSSFVTAPQSPAKKVIPPPQAQVPATHPLNAPVQPSLQMPAPQPSHDEPEKPAETEEPTQDASSFEQDIDTFDTLDLDDVTDKIRNDCKTMIKQLQLEHLMER
jgi:hypothetical protein